MSSAETIIELSPEHLQVAEKLTKDLTDEELAQKKDRFEVITSWDLANKEFPGIKWIIPDLCPEGKKNCEKIDIIWDKIR